MRPTSWAQQSSDSTEIGTSPAKKERRLSRVESTDLTLRMYPHPLGRSNTVILLFQVTGASIQVASEMLPNSTERTVTISGSADSITQCIYHICCVMLEVISAFLLPIGSQDRKNTRRETEGRNGHPGWAGGNEGMNCCRSSHTVTEFVQKRKCCELEIFLGNVFHLL